MVKPDRYAPAADPDCLICEGAGTFLRRPCSCEPPKISSKPIENFHWISEANLHDLTARFNALSQTKEVRTKLREASPFPPARYSAADVALVERLASLKRERAEVLTATHAASARLRLQGATDSTSDIYKIMAERKRKERSPFVPMRPVPDGVRPRSVFERECDKSIDDCRSFGAEANFGGQCTGAGPYGPSFTRCPFVFGDDSCTVGGL